MGTVKVAAAGRCITCSSSLELSDSESEPPVAKNRDIIGYLVYSEIKINSI